MLIISNTIKITIVNTITVANYIYHYTKYNLYQIFHSYLQSESIQYHIKHYQFLQPIPVANISNTISTIINVITTTGINIYHYIKYNSYQIFRYCENGPQPLSPYP